jgi:hypothetical protein
MAETVKIKIETQGADKLTDNLQEAVEVGKSLKAQYKEAVLEVQRLAAAYGETSVEVTNAAKKAASLKDTIEDTNDAISAFKGEGAFLAMGRAVGAVSSGFTAVQGGLGLLGVESDKIEETLLRVQSAMALTQGLAGLEDAGRAFKTLKTVAGEALNVIKTGIGATGIGVLLIALGAVVAYWDEISVALGIVTDEQKKLNEAQIAQKKVADEQTASVKKESAEFVGLVSMLKATNVGSKERENLIKNINKQYGTTLKNIKDETSFQNQLNLAVENYIIQKQNEFALKANEGTLTELFQKKSDATKEFNKQLKDLTDGYTLVDKEQGLYLSNSAKSDTVLDRTTGKYVSAAVTLGDLRDKNSLVNTEMLKQERIMSNVDGRIENLSKTNLKLGASNKMVTTTTDDVIDKTKEATETIKDYTKEIVDAQINLIADESQRQQTKLISDADFRKKDIENSNASAEQKAALTKAIDAQLVIDLDAMDKDFNDKRLAREKQLITDMITEDEKYLNKLNAARDLETSYMVEGVDKDVKMRENKYQDELVLLQKYLDDDTLTRAQYDLLTVEAEKKKAADIKVITDKSADDLRQAKIKEYDDTLKFGGDVVNAIGGLTDVIFQIKKNGLEKGSEEELKAAKKQFNANKALQISLAVITGIQSVMAAYENGMKNPIPLLGPLTGIAYAITAGVTSAANIAKIASTKFDPGTTPSTPPPSAPPPPPDISNLAPPTPSSLTLNGSAMSGSEGSGLQLFGARQGSGNTRSYVVESDITGTQKRLRTYQQRAEIG